MYPSLSPRPRGDISLYQVSNGIMLLYLLRRKGLKRVNTRLNIFYFRIDIKC
jgi:hypothetical protein